MSKKKAKELWDKVFGIIYCPKCGTRIRDVDERIKHSWRMRTAPELRFIQCKHCHYKIELEVSESGEILNVS